MECLMHMDGIVAEREAQIGSTSVGSLQELVTVFEQSRAPEDFEPLIDACLDKVRGVIYKIILNQNELDDLTQEAFIRAYRKFDSFRGKSSFSTWVCQIAVNNTLNHIRKRKRIVQADDFVLDNQTSSPKERPDRAAIRGEHRGLVDKAIRKLPEHLRVVLVLTVIEDMETEDIAKACGCAKATIYWRLHKARKEMKRIMRELEGDHNEQS